MLDFYCMDCLMTRWGSDDAVMLDYHGIGYCLQINPIFLNPLYLCTVLYVSFLDQQEVE